MQELLRKTQEIFIRLNKNQMLIHTVVVKKGIKKCCLELEKVYERDETPCGQRFGYFEVGRAAQGEE